MEDQKSQELGLNQTPINDVFKISQLPPNFRYGQKTQYAIFEKELEILPTTGNGTYLQSSDLKYTLSAPSHRMSFLYGPGSYLSFLLTVTGAVGALDATTSCLFSEIRTTGATTLEYFSEQNVLMNILMDQCSPEARGTYYSFFGNRSHFGELAVVAAQTYSLPAATIREGYLFAIAEARRLLCLLPSGIWGCWQKNLLPLSEIPSGLQINLRTETNARAFVGAAGTIMNLTDNRLRMSIIELNDFLSSSVRKIYDNLYIVPFETYFSYQSSIAVGQTSGVLNIPVNYKYVKAIIVCFRAQALDIEGQRSLSSRAKANLGEYSFVVNGQMLPASPVYIDADGELTNLGVLNAGNADARGFMQVQKIWNNIPAFNSTCSYGLNEFSSRCLLINGGTADANVSGKGAFFMGLNLESLTSEGNLFRTTTQASGGIVQFKYRFNVQVPALGALNVSAFLWVEGDLVIENGVANVDL